MLHIFGCGYCAISAKKVAVGTKTGAAVGSVLGPGGAAIGAVVGGLLGGWAAAEGLKQVMKK